MKEPILKTTRDGSHTLFSDHFNEHYHSVHGAAQESKHVFIDMGLKCLNDRDQLNILEMGLGTGLNTLLTLDFHLKNPAQKIRYDSLEKFPITSETAKRLNHGDFSPFEGTKATESIEKIHESPWGEAIRLAPDFEFYKWKQDALQWQTEIFFDLVYYDAFAPNKQPELWAPTTFEIFYRRMAPKGVWVTYCAKGQVKRDLKSVGFEVETLPGPPGKREMIRASKK